MRPDIRVVILNVHEEEPFISRRLAAGADGFLSKRYAPAELGGLSPTPLYHLHPCRRASMQACP